MHTYKEREIARAVKRAQKFERWRERHPDAWARVIRRATSSNGAIGADVLTNGLVPIWLVSAAAVAVARERPDVRVIIRQTADFLV